MGDWGNLGWVGRVGIFGVGFLVGFRERRFKEILWEN